MADKLDVTKRELVDDAIITKEPLKETKTEQIPIMHKELVIEDQLLIIHNHCHLIIIFQKYMKMKNLSL
jgi:hypothetical protein